MSVAMQVGAGERFPRETSLAAWLAAGLVLSSSIQVAVLAASMLSLPLTRAGAGAILVLSLAAAWLVLRRAAGGDGGAAGRGRPTLHTTRSVRALWAGGLFLVLYLFLFACAVAVPDVSWDGNSYHLPTIQQWFQHHRVVWVDGPEVSVLRNVNGYPKAAEVMSLFLAELVHPALVKTANLVYLPLGMLAIVLLARELGATSVAALAAGAALLLVPINLGQSATTYVDSAFGSAVIAWLAVTVHFRRLDRRRLALQALTLGCALGQVIGIKGTGIALGAVGTLALFAVHTATRERALSLSALLAWWSGVAMTALAVGGFWYLRNLAHGQSPLYPVGVSIGGLTLWSGYDAYLPAGAFAVDGEIATWPVPAQIAFTWLQGLWKWPGSIVGFDMRLGGLGFLWALGCLPAVFTLVRRRLATHAAWRDELVREPLWLLLAIVAIGIAIVPCPWWSRFTIWIYGLGLPCLAAAQRSWTSRFGRTWLASCAALALLEAGIVLVRWQVPLLGVAVGIARGEPSRPIFRIPSHFYPPWNTRGNIVEELARNNDGVGIGTLDWYQEPLVGVLSQPVGARRIDFVPGDLERDFHSWFERVHPRYILMDKAVAIPEVMSHLQPQVHQTRSLTVLQFW